MGYLPRWQRVKIQTLVAGLGMIVRMVRRGRQKVGAVENEGNIGSLVSRTWWTVTKTVSPVSTYLITASLRTGATKNFSSTMTTKRQHLSWKDVISINYSAHTLRTPHWIEKAAQTARQNPCSRAQDTLGKGQRGAGKLTPPLVAPMSKLISTSWSSQLQLTARIR
ncbi:hypothetical protein BDM02DRAFT_1806956 [Thelephora ganbajun]|uniref:Uncharacterized protein n=1 Tax=Thelephora ganbajun TaxID=370292 RepID=A0ACB6ZJG9_THEGA|nr:hypothetical protein BDM02DRAFT_1806956 [Thelephora ganbajun]